jgi:hypothetical protein
MEIWPMANIEKRNTFLFQILSKFTNRTEFKSKLNFECLLITKIKSNYTQQQKKIMQWHECNNQLYNLKLI